MLQFIRKDIERQQKEMDEWFLEKQKTLPLPEGILIDRDIPYIDDGKNCHKMDVYYTPLTEEEKPVIFDFHGGGLLLCDRTFNQWFCSHMAKRGFVVFCIDYPLVPDVDVYTILKDAYTGIVKACSYLEKYRGDKNRLYLCGDSAGGFISTYLSAIQNNPEIAESLGIQLENIHFQALAAISAMFYSSKIDKQGIFVLRRDFYGKKYRKHPFWKFVNPEQSAITDHLAPGLYLTSRSDYLRDYTIRFVDALRNSKSQAFLADYRKNEALTHDFVCLMPETEEAQDAMNRIASFFHTK